MAFRIESLADLPEKYREQVAKAVVSQQKKSKYGNVKTEVNGIKFDSQKEARRYQTLMLAQKSGLIRDLRLQHEFTLQEAYTTCTGKRIRAIKYRADFTYYMAEGGSMVIEDVKSTGTKTKEYELKKKLMADKGYTILEV